MAKEIDSKAQYEAYLKAVAKTNAQMTKKKKAKKSK